MTDVKVLSTHAVQQVLCELGPGFERALGVRLDVDYDPANALKRKIENGAPFDVAIVTRSVFDSLTADGTILRNSCVDIARSGLGIAVRKGMARPDITTTAAFKSVLLAAPSVVRSKEGTSGAYFETLLDHLGIAETMRGRIILGGSGRVAELVARGDAELAVQQIPELLPVAGIDVVGPLPPDLQLYTVFSAGVGGSAKNPCGGHDLITYLTRKEWDAIYSAKGLEPMTR